MNVGTTAPPATVAGSTSAMWSRMRVAKRPRLSRRWRAGGATMSESLEPWGEHRMERLLEKAAAAGVEMTWQIDEHSAQEPKTRARIERARSRGYKAKIIPGLTEHRLIFFGRP